MPGSQLKEKVIYMFRSWRGFTICLRQQLKYKPLKTDDIAVHEFFNSLLNNTHPLSSFRYSKHVRLKQDKHKVRTSHIILTYPFKGDV